MRQMVSYNLPSGRRKRRHVCIGAIVLIAMLILAGCGQNDQVKVSDDGFFLDTECSITVFADDEEKGKQIIEDAFALCEQYEDKMSKTRKGSDIYKLNNSDGKPVKVDSSVSEVIGLGLEMGKESKGRFDITIGRLTDLWDFKAEDPKVPGKASIRRAVKTVGYENIETENDKVRIKGGEAHIDLGGLAKGWISEKVAELIKEKGVSSGILNFGGNVITIGKKPDGSPWKVGIQDPNEKGQNIIGATEAKDQAVITSGIYERKFEKNGRIYHHIIDPETGYPVESDVEGVTLKCPREKAGKCDAYSTICLLKGSSEGMKFIGSKKGFEALFYCKDGSVKKTEGMDFNEKD